MKLPGQVKVVFAGRYNKSEDLSGPEKVAKRIFNEYTSQAPSVFIEYFFDGNRFGYLKKLFGKEIIQENSESKIVRAGLFRLLPLLLLYKPEIVHIITYERFAVILLLYKLFTKVKFIYNVHGVIAYENSFVRKVPFLYKFKDRVCEFMYMKCSDKIIFYSETSLDLAEKYFRIDESKVIILSNGVDEIFSTVLQHRNNSNHSLKVVLMGDFDLMDNRLGLLNEIIGFIKYPVEISLVGNVMNGAVKGDEQVLVRFVKRMDTHRLAEFYKDKDVYLSLKDYETFSISAVEAMATGMIPIMSEGTGMSRYILDGENGYILGDLTPQSVASRINLLAADHCLRSRLSVNSAKIFDYLSWNDVFKTFSNIYSDMEKK
jgi:glycosyltransferase involved in cell wall biosynthesis